MDCNTCRYNGHPIRHTMMRRRRRPGRLLATLRAALAALTGFRQPKRAMITSVRGMSVPGANHVRTPQA